MPSSFVLPPLMRFWFPSKDLLQLPRSKSRTLLRAISTTFRSRSPVSPVSPSPASTTLHAKQNREAALRERGLLPPLAPPKDLSRQEADQDRRIPIVSLDRKSADDAVEPSAADLIKQEWEAKNKSSESAASTETEERERMKSFRFGAPSPKAAEFSVARELETVAEVNTPLPSPLTDGDMVPPLVPMKDSPRRASSHRSSASVDHIDPVSLPLPPSPLPTPPQTPSKATTRKSTSISSATSHPPSSFHYARHGDADSTSSSSGHNRSGSKRSSTSAPPPTNPAISLSPPAHISAFAEPSSSSSVVSIPHRRSESLTKLPSISESASLMTPSLDPSSKTVTTVSTLNTTESHSVVPGTNSGTAKGKNGLLKVKTSDHIHDIPMIIESPVEDAIATGPETIPEEVPLPLSPISESHSPTLMVPQHPVPTRRARGLTDPGNASKRKSFNPFKRNQPVGLDESEDTGSSKRISVSASLGNLRKAASNLTRPRSSYDGASVAPSTKSGKARTFDVSHLPPSPTLPTHFKSTPGAGVDGRTTGVGLRTPVRRPLEPTLHSRASILMEMNAIQDDEVRRMTEVAFLG